MIAAFLVFASVHSPCLDFARTEFAKHLPGAKISLELKVDESLGADAFRIRERGGALEVTGGNGRGCLYGVYSFLENECGARFYTSWCSKPPVPPAAVPRELDRTERPAFEARMPYWWDIIYHPEFAAKLRVNANPFGTLPEFVGGNACRFGKGLPSCHTLGSLLPDARNLCLTDATNLAVVTERVLAHIAADPDARFYGISYDDNETWCHCPRCEEINRGEGSPAGTLVRFVNAIADVVAEKFPKATLETLAYQHTVVPPKKTRLRKNVIVCLCSNKCEFTYPFEESPFEENREFVQAMTDWGKMSPLYVWDYTTCFCGYPKPFPNGAVLLKNIRSFRDHGVRYLFEQGDYQGVHADFGEWKTYLQAKAMWNPDLDEETLRKDFFAGYYGAGAPFVDACYRKAIAVQRDYIGHNKDHRMVFGFEGPLPAFTPEVIAELRQLWTKADEATRTDKAANYNVRMGAMSLDFHELLMEFAKPAQDLVRQKALASRIRSCIREARPKTLTLLEFPQSLLGRINALTDTSKDVTGRAVGISACWIGADRDASKFVRFKNTFESDGTLLRLHVSADETFALYVDARLIGRGNSALEGRTYRSYELDLSPGQHKLEVVVFVGPDCRRVPSLLVQAEGNFYGSQLTTGQGKWRARTFDNVAFRSNGVFIDGDSPWDDFWDAFVGGTKVVTRDDAQGLSPSHRPPSQEDRQLLYGKTPLEIPAKSTRQILWDLDAVQSGYPGLTIAPGTGAGLRVRWEWLDDSPTGETTASDESVHKGGAGGEGFTTPWPRCGRWCRLTFTAGEKSAIVARIAIEKASAVKDEAR